MKSISDELLIKQIQKYWNPLESRTGNLIKIKFTFKFNSAWHFAIALSDKFQISWVPCIENSLYCNGHIELGDLDSKFENVNNVCYLDNKDIYQNLIASVSAFHNKWNYGIQGWNCEHYSRLITTNQPVSYQIKKDFFGIGNIRIFGDPGTQSFRPEAIDQLQKYK